MIHIYEGNGKGKTTCAAGLALRAAGHGIPVIFAQFMKDGSSGEVRMLEQLEQITVVHPKVFYGFYSRMNEQQKKESALEAGRMFQELTEQALRRCDELPDAGSYTSADTLAGDPTDGPVMLLVMDEVLNAVNYGLLSDEDLLGFLDKVPGSMEVVLTGKSSTPKMKQKADYITSFTKMEHPYDHGIKARPGIEY
jgi:cob(I)alamin adenosyltransferase